MIANFLRDTARSLRSWRRTPGSALLVILALGLSGGALLTLVSLLNALFWRDLPVSHPNELVGVYARDHRFMDWQDAWIPGSLFTTLGRAQNVFQSFAAAGGAGGGRLAIEGVTGNYFETLGVRATLGELVGPRDVDQVAPVGTISFRYWHDNFQADPKVIGQTFPLEGEPVTIVGVASAGFTGLEVDLPTDAWVPESLILRVDNVPPALDAYRALVGRLRPGVTLQQARAQLESLWPTARQTAAAAVGGVHAQALDKDTLVLEPRVESAARGYTEGGAYYRPTLVALVLLSAITIVLSCANLSGLLLARWAGREADLAVQAALGASNGRLISQVIGESLALSTVAVVLCVPLALWSAKSLVRLLWNQPGAPSPLDLHLDYRLLGVVVLMAGLIAVLVSLLPASRIWSAKLLLIRGTRGLPGRSGTQWGRRLAAAQVALSVPLLVTTWIVATNLHRLEAVSTGFRADGVFGTYLSPRTGIAPVADPVAYFRQVISALRATPAISAAALTWNTPMTFSADGRRREVSRADSLRGARPFLLQVTPGYFDTLSVPVLAGRDFGWTDDTRQPNVAIASAGLAHALFPDANPVGQRVRLGGHGGQPDRLLDVIGVVADAKLAEPHATNQLFLFTALLQETAHALQNHPPNVLLKSPLAAHTVESEAQRAVVALGHDDVDQVQPLLATRDAALLRERVMRLGAFYFAGLTTLLVFVGLFAVLNIGVMRRIPEIGLRLALGASTTDICLTVIRDAWMTAAAGLLLGLPLALLAGRLIASTLTLAGWRDPLAFGTAIVLVFATAALSVVIPVRRASRVTPVEALGGL